LIAEDAPNGVVSEDGAFTLHDVPASLYRIGVDMPGDLYLKSVMMDGQDIREPGVDLSVGATSVTLHVILSANGASVEGSVENGEGAEVTLIPADPQIARTQAKSTTAGPDGSFSFDVLPPGRYALLAWEHVDINAALYDADFRKPFESYGQTIDLQEKQKATVKLKLIPRPEN
jgi:hypothetical protein